MVFMASKPANLQIDLTLTDSCPVCSRNKYYIQPDGRRKCRQCGNVYEGKFRLVDGKPK